jgi:DNA-binding transcriptional regulator YhcF (GntR family)
VLLQTPPAKLKASLFRPAIVRRGLAPINRQLRAAVELAVVRGELQKGTPLPSVRQLARRLNIASGTVLRAYQSLVAEGIIESRPRRGYFAADTITPPMSGVEDTLVSLIDQAVDASLQVGMDSTRLLALISERLPRDSHQERRVAVVGQRESALEERAAVVAEAIQDLGVKVVELSFEELSVGKARDKLVGIEWFIVPVLEFELAQRLLGPRGHRILPMTRALRADVQEFIRSQPANARFGVIAAGEEWIGRMLSALQALHPLTTAPLTASISNASQVDKIRAEADAIVVATLARKALAARGPLSVPTVAWIYVPDDATLRRLRGKLMSPRD